MLTTDRLSPLTFLSRAVPSSRRPSVFLFFCVDSSFDSAQTRHSRASPTQPIACTGPEYHPLRPDLPALLGFAFSVGQYPPHWRHLCIRSHTCELARHAKDSRGRVRQFGFEAGEEERQSVGIVEAHLLGVIPTGSAPVARRIFRAVSHLDSRPLTSLVGSCHMW